MDWIRAFTAKPYPPREALGLIWRNLAGASFRNSEGLRFVPRQTRLNDIEPRITLGFGGDVMSMFGKALVFDPAVANFFLPCDKVLLNFEGVITERRQISPDQKHTRPILQALDGLAARSKLVLSLANNHTGDFGEVECRQSLALLREEGFTAFGLTESPCIDLGERLRVVTGTRWSNREGQHLAWLKDPAQWVRPGAFNLLYPHWGYELEVYPRRDVAAQMTQWLAAFDAVVGHHSHTPQPINVQRGGDGLLRLAAYSMGDLCFGMAYRNLPTFKYYAFGLIGRMTIGPLHTDPSRWAAGELTWSFVECRPLGRGQGFEVVLQDQIPLFASDAIAAPATAEPQAVSAD
ncbi:MAG TPA: CapA family protein [Candidatus Aquabacterium excrementipullorum]|nr:CapA family protein [Candidatus Aquabacterium excrementipullorum]